MASLCEKEMLRIVMVQFLLLDFVFAVDWIGWCVCLFA